MMTKQSQNNNNKNNESVDDGQCKESTVIEQDIHWKKYSIYHVEVDPNQDDKATEILLCSLDRPHMRAFHCAWLAFFAAFFMWFSIQPLTNAIRDDLHLTKTDIWNSNIAGVGGTIVMRILLGPLCDVYGPRILFSFLLCASAIPTACTGFINSANGLIILRVFIGIAGGSFVTCEYWTSRMFTKEVVGTANALVAGWGNLGAGVTELVVGSILFPIFHSALGGNTERAWRTLCLLPAMIGFAMGVIIYFVSDDAPKGNYSELKQHGAFPGSGKPTPNPVKSLLTAACNPNAWILFVQYAACFGVELTMYSAASSYFRDEFGQSTAAAGAIASIFGWLNLFARGMGGYISDYANSHWGMRGRLWANTIMLLLEGAMVFCFLQTTSFGGSIITLVVFSLFVQASEGTVFAIVPYIDPPNMGSTIGLVGAGGNVGAVVFNVAFREWHYNKVFRIMGMTCLVASTFSLLVHIRGHGGLICCRDQNVNLETGEIIVPQPRSRSRTVDAATAMDSLKEAQAV